MTIIQDYIPAGRRNRPAKPNACLYVTIHNTGNAGKGANARSHTNYIKSDAAANAPVSWHYTVDDTGAYQHLPDNETAYHAGDGSGMGNTKSIGIEICMNSDGDLLKATDNAAMLTAELCIRHDIPIDHVVQHNHWSGKACPEKLRDGRPYSWAVFLAKVGGLVRNSAGATPLIAAASATAAQAEEWARGLGASEEFIGLAQKYWDYAQTCGGCNPAVAYAQAALETNSGRFNGIVDACYHNPCRFRAAGGAGEQSAYHRFISWEEGVRAHLDHLALYAGATGYPRAGSPDPQHDLQLTGIAKTVESMGVHWSPDNAEYAATLLSLMAKMAGTDAARRETAGAVVKFNILGRTVEISGALQNGSVYAAARPLLEALGYSVAWDGLTQTVVILRPAGSVKLDLFGKAVEVPGWLADGTNYVALRALLEAMELEVSWIPETQTVAVRRGEGALL